MSAGAALALLAVYFVPTIVAELRKTDHWVGITLLNLLLGWTLIGWVIALVWAVSDNPRAPAGRPCPFCAESILPAAKICKHCGRALPDMPRAGAWPF